MSINKMLIDAAHAEETRVSVLREGRVEEFDYESATRKPLRGNIYLAKVTRVEPSLQAAFVDYGGNRHGFLAFNEIHPDYYQIPVADREALLEAEAEDARAASAEEEARESETLDDRGEEAAVDDQGDGGEEGEEEITDLTDEAGDAGDDEPVTSLEVMGAGMAAANHSGATVAEEIRDDGEIDASERAENTAENDGLAVAKDEELEAVGSDDALADVPVRRRKSRRTYRIQEVIKRRQIILIQVVKEERGNKGAALTTYLSLAGRHTVLMPNTARGGGISRKITNISDRKRLRQIVSELDVPEGTGLIVRTAGAARTKAEIKRDFEYLLRLWENVRDLTLKSTAPTLVYEEGNLIKRSIRDLYSKEIDEVLVSGDVAYREAKEFMRMLMPSHAKNVKKYEGAEPLFAKYQIERHLNEMFSPVVTLASGGYIVVNQTEALVAIDVNSGKSTRQHSIEETAIGTNLEAAEEISRQLKLRDLAGLIVIDFIDMDERRNNRYVERKLKECLKNDRARIQVGRISHFGLLEMSRQRLRTGVLEGSTSPCQYCQGTGTIRSTESVALSVLRSLEDTLMAGEKSNLNTLTPTDVALYILNEKRDDLADMQKRYGVTVRITGSDRLQGANYTIERMAGETGSQKTSDVVVQMEWGSQAPAKETASAEPSKRKPRRRRRRRQDDAETTEDAASEATEVEARDSKGGDEEDEKKVKRSRRRGKRGGRRTRRGTDAEESSAEEMTVGDGANGGKPGPEERAASANAAEETSTADGTGAQETIPRRRRSPRRQRRQSENAEAIEETSPAAVAADSGEVPATARNGISAQPGENPQLAEDSQAVTSKSGAEAAVDVADIQVVETQPLKAPSRRGWWQRK